jgi:hypothetical protein
MHMPIPTLYRWIENANKLSREQENIINEQINKR